MDSLTILVIIAMAATVVVLFAGLTSMVSGGEYDRQHSVQLMFTRIGLQAIVIILLIVAALYAGNFA
jgi:hypoxia induced protein